jgi:hypothetical protein
MKKIIAEKYWCPAGVEDELKDCWKVRFGTDHRISGKGANLSAAVRAFLRCCNENELPAQRTCYRLLPRRHLEY